MHLSCNTPALFWDEFCTISAYLSNLTSSSSLNGKTPYKSWTGHIPSLLHLCEIGCRAFALIQMHNPKIYCHSCPYILIGYTLHTKAYHLWDTVNESIFNSFHITFLEHLDEQLVNLLPGTTICIEPNATLSWDAAPHPPIPPPPPSISTSNSTIPTIDPPLDGKNHQILMPSSTSSNITPSKNHLMLTPGSLSVDTPSSSVHQSS